MRVSVTDAANAVPRSTVPVYPGVALLLPQPGMPVTSYRGCRGSARLDGHRAGRRRLPDQPRPWLARPMRCRSRRSWRSASASRSGMPPESRPTLPAMGVDASTGLLQPPSVGFPPAGSEPEAVATGKLGRDLPVAESHGPHLLPQGTLFCLRAASLSRAPSTRARPLRPSRGAWPT
jgi:hypothetical protein